MAQHDYNIANQTGLEFRSDINNLAQAIVTQNSGPTAPSPTYAGMVWLDTSTSPPVERRRNAANTTWETVLTESGRLVSGAADASAQRTALGLGTAATLNTGTSANSVVKLDSSARLPAVDASQLTNLPIPPATPQRIRQAPVMVATGAYSSGSVAIPADDTIPQITEGNEFLSASIVPTAADSILEIEVLANMDNQSGSYLLIGALFKDSGPNAIAVSFTSTQFTLGCQLKLKHRIVAGSTASQTFRFRAGASSEIVVSMNGYTGRLFGGVVSSYIKITEYAPS